MVIRLSFDDTKHGAFAMRTGVFPTNTHCVALWLDHREYLLQRDSMRPGIAKVIEVVEPLAMTNDLEQYFLFFIIMSDRGENRCDL
jgi:hypothetical protein